MKRIGIICATIEELEPLLGSIDFEAESVNTKAMLTFHQGKIHGVPVVLVTSGVCKVNGAIATQLLVDYFDVDIVINGGTAGGMDRSVDLLDTVISERVGYHDVGGNILTECHPNMKSIFFDADTRLITIAKEYSKTSVHRILFGTTVSGEQFIEDENREEINGKFNPLSVDMETAGVAHACYVNNVPFIAIRSVTDTADHKGAANFERNCKRASEISAEVIKDMLEAFSE